MGFARISLTLRRGSLGFAQLSLGLAGEPGKSNSGKVLEPRKVPREPKRAPRRPQEKPKRAPRKRKRAPREPQENPRERMRAPREAQDALRQPQDSPRKPQESSKRAPREPKAAPGAAQESPKRAQRAPREPKREPILSLFTVIARSWAIFVQAWKAEFVAIYGNRAILGHLRAGSEGRFCRYLR